MNFIMIHIFLPEIKEIEKVEKLIVTLYDKKKYVIHVQNVK